jgi:hypothetical protein
MPKILSIRIGFVDSVGVFQPLAVGRPVYLKPSRTDISYLNAGVYLPWELNQTSDAGFQDCRRAVTNGSGIASFVDVPFTDTEMHRPLDPNTGLPVGPEIEWNFINPWGSNGTVVYSGKLLSTMTLPAPVNVPDDLTQLNGDAWRISGAAYLATPIGGSMYAGQLTFPVGVNQLAITFPSPFATPPRVHTSGCYDRDRNFSAPGFAQDGSGLDLVTTANATIQVAGGLTSDVRVPFLVLGA